ncbi:MAG: hypothetical protein WC373_04695 [Smithella sp.]
MPYKSKFESIFKLPLQKYAHPLFGFDIIRFDEDLKTPDGTSTSDFIKEKYGKEAVELISKMINMLTA